MEIWKNYKTMNTLGGDFVEEKLIIQLNAVEIKNLKVFLSRVDLKGAEVYEFASILHAIETAAANKDTEKAGE